MLIHPGQQLTYRIDHTFGSQRSQVTAWKVESDQFIRLQTHPSFLKAMRN